MITRTDIVAHLEYGMRTGFLAGQRGYTPLRGQFVKEANSDGAFETYADMGAVPWPARITGAPGLSTDARTGAPVINQTLEGGPITILGGNERALIVNNLGWDIPIGIYHDAINDNRVGSLESWARGAGSRFEQHIDYLCFDALNAGEATTSYGSCYDGLSFFNDSHVDPNAQYTTTQDNKLATAFSFDNFKAAKIAASKFKDDRGQPVGYVHNLLVVPVDLEYEAAQVTTNPERYDTADRARNPYNSMTMLVAPGGWLDTAAWVLIATGMPAKPINLQMRQRPQLFTWDDHTQGGGVRYYKWYSRYSVFYGDWRLAILGHT